MFSSILINHPPLLANLEDASQVAARDVDAHVRLVLPLHLARQHHLQRLLKMFFLHAIRVFKLEQTFEPD